ncbi:MAG: hypothetical protein AAFY56_04325 [Pseudomonadota bacterium]
MDLPEHPESLPDPRHLLEEGLIDDAVGAAFDMLESAQTASSSREIGEPEIFPAMYVLANGSAASALYCEAFRTALKTPDPSIRVKAAGHALELIRSMYEE